MLCSAPDTRLAAPGEHRGGFGTCGPGAGSRHTMLRLRRPRRIGLPRPHDRGPRPSPSESRLNTHPAYLKGGAAVQEPRQNTSVAGHPTPTPGKAVDKAHGPYREPTPTTLIPEGFEPRRWHTTNREAHMGSQHAPFQVHADPRDKPLKGTRSFAGDTHPSAGRRAETRHEPE